MASEQPAPVRGRRHAWTRILLAAAVGGVAALLVTPLVPSVKKDMGPAVVSARADLGRGQTVVRVPPLGTVSAPTHSSILTADVSLVSVDFARLLELSSTHEGRNDLLDQVESDLRALSVRLAVQLLAGAAVAGGVAGALAFHRKWSLIAAGACGGVIVMGIVLALSAASFDPEAFEEPRYSGALVDAPEVIETVRRGVGAVEQLHSRYEEATRRLSRLLVLMAKPADDPRSGTVAILHVSDIHTNPLGTEITDQLAREFEVDAVLDTGDLGSFGEPVEASITRLIDDISVPYLFVPGNHDSSLLEDTMAGLDNVRLLDRTATRVGDVEILGWGDPVFTESHRLSFEEGVDLKQRVGEHVAARVRSMQPDVLAVHDKRLAEESYGDVPLVLSGHYHERQMEEVEGTHMLAVGSTGATGLKSFALETEMSYEAEVVYFRDSVAVAMDYVSFRGLGEEFIVERVTLDPDDEVSTPAAP
ncbi:MAG: metallophosphoesterase family protein [Actinomycetota bacterium]